MIKRMCCLLTALCFFTLVGCQGVYMGDRGRDFVDMWRLGVTSGPGFLINARATKIVQAGIGGYDVFKAGVKGRSNGIWREFRGEGGVSLVYFIDFDKQFVTGNQKLANRIDSYNPKEKKQEVLGDIDPFYGDRSFTEIGFDIHIFAIGFEFAWDFYSFLDFMGGWFLLDPQQDDVRTRRKKEGIPPSSPEETSPKKDQLSKN